MSRAVLFFTSTSGSALLKICQQQLPVRSLISSRSLSSAPKSPQTFYTSPLSPNTWRVAIYLHEKGIKHTVKNLNLREKEQKTPEFLKINPRGQVPAWVDGDVAVAESLAIMMYLEHKHKNHPLIPTSDRDYATFLTRLFQFPAKLDNAGITSAVFFGKKTKEDLRDKITALLKEIREWDRALEGREYLASTFSIADIAIIPNITGNVELLGLDLSQFPHLEGWYRRMWARPSVKETPNHCVPLSKMPHERVLEGVKLN